MGFKDKLGNFFGIDDGEYDEYVDDYDYDEPVVEEREPERERRPVSFTRENLKDSRIVENPDKPHMKLIVNEPKAFDECSKIVDNLRNKKPIIMNLEKLETEVAKRIFDFVSGATYALDGSVQKVANNIFVFAPDNVDIASNIEEFKTLNNSNLFR